MRTPVPEGPDGSAEATLGGGCFWCLEAAYLRVKGVHSVTSGYAGGSYPDPTYPEVCSGHTGHAEVVRIVHDPEVVSFRDLLRIFFTVHDPTTPDRQGADRGPQYRSIIVCHDATQEAEARAVMEEIEAAGLFDAPLVTELAPLETFYPAEVEHAEYYDRNPDAMYCRAVIAPKLRKMRISLAPLLRDEG